MGDSFFLCEIRYALLYIVQANFFFFENNYLVLNVIYSRTNCGSSFLIKYHDIDRYTTYVDICLISLLFV
jgi:hypothetical protein